MLLDSNIVLYATKPEHTALRQFISEHAPSVSVISYIAVLGFHRITEAERQHLEQFFAVAEVLPLSDAVAGQAVLLRQRRRMSLGDSIVAATALVHGYTLVTRDTDDFRWIPDLQLLDPLA
jgi:predicted nucleic acid-binding protein